MLSTVLFIWCSLEGEHLRLKFQNTVQNCTKLYKYLQILVYTTRAHCVQIYYPVSHYMHTSWCNILQTNKEYILISILVHITIVTYNAIMLFLGHSVHYELSFLGIMNCIKRIVYKTVHNCTQLYKTVYNTIVHNCTKLYTTVQNCTYNTVQIAITLFTFTPFIFIITSVSKTVWTTLVVNNERINESIGWPCRTDSIHEVLRINDACCMFLVIFFSSQQNVFSPLR